MSVVQSSGLLLYRRVEDQIEVLLGHMGGPFWTHKREHAWSIPKGLAEDGEADLLAIAEREFAEEMGSPAPEGQTVDLGSVKAGRKSITVYLREGSFETADQASNTFEMEWPKGSGQMQHFPEIDRAEWVRIDQARDYLTKGQGPFIDRVIETLGL